MFGFDSLAVELIRHAQKREQEAQEAGFQARGYFACGENRLAFYALTEAFSAGKEADDAHASAAAVAACEVAS